MVLVSFLIPLLTALNFFSHFILILIFNFIIVLWSLCPFLFFLQYLVYVVGGFELKERWKSGFEWKEMWRNGYELKRGGGMVMN